MNQTPIMILAVIFGLAFSIIILKQPYLGLTFTIISTPISSLLPPIPYFTSVVPLIGLVTLAGFLWERRTHTGKISIRFNFLHFISLLFLVWIYISNPQAAWSGPSRNWVLTYLQLLILMVIAGDLLNEPHKHYVVMAIFALISVVSAYTAITQGYIGEDILEAARVGGFTAGANTAARYFVVSMVFATYLRSKLEQPFLRLIMLGAIFITYLGVFFTASRSGMVLIFFAQLLLFFIQHEGKRRVQMMVIFGLAFVILILMANTIIGILQGILPAILQGTDTVGLRYDIWEAGWLMWRDHPISGVGIGMFSSFIRRYMLQIGAAPRGFTAHNTYISVLAETGIIGFILFMSVLGISIWYFIKAVPKLDSEQLELRNVWFVVIIVILTGALTKTEHVDKLLWMVMGISTYFITLGAPASEEPQKEDKLKTLRDRKFVSHY